MDKTQLEKIRSGQGFFAALDQSGGSTPKALAQYGIAEDRYHSEDEMFDLIHAMRTRVITSPAFDGSRILGAILFEQTMDRDMAGRPDGAVPVGHQAGRAVPEGRQGARRRAVRRPAHEADRHAGRAARARERAPDVRHQDAIGDQGRRQGRGRRDRRPADRVRRADLGGRPGADSRARGQHRQPAQRRSREAAARCAAVAASTRCRATRDHAQADDPGTAGPLCATSPPTRACCGCSRCPAVTAATRRAAAREGARHDRELLPRPAGGAVRRVRATRSSTPRLDASIAQIYDASVHKRR